MGKISVNDLKCTSWWFDWSDLQYPAPAVVERWEKRAEIFAAAGVDCVVTFGFHFRWDWLNFWERHFSILRKVVEICHKHNIKVIEHHSNQLTHHIRCEADREHIITYQDHHLPLFPDSWDNQIVNGRKLADWRMISVHDNQPIFINNYKAEAFCPSNPDYIAEYQKYLQLLIEKTGIDGLMSDDTAFHGDIYSCGCPYCRERFKKSAGIELPPETDRDFWENHSNPPFLKWIEMRYDITADFYRQVRAVLPENMPLLACSCSDSHQYKVRQGCSMEQWSEFMDLIFVEMYHGWDLETDADRIITEIAAASSIADYRKKKALILSYSDDVKVFQQWADLCASYGTLTWFSRQVRKFPVIYEEVTLKDGYPVSQEAVKPYSCGIVYSRRVKNKFNEKELHYFDALCKTVLSVHNRNMRPQIIFDTLRPDKFEYDKIFVPCYDELDGEFKKWLTDSKCKIYTEV